MKTNYGNTEYIKKVARMQIQAMQVNPPAILFRRDRSKADVNGENETKKLKIKTDPTDEESDELEVRATVFDQGDAEGWVQWRIQLDDLIRDMVMTTGRQKTVLAKALLKGNAREKLSDILLDLEINAEGGEEADEENYFAEAIELLGLDYFPSENSFRRQRNYLRYHVFMMEMSLSDFKAELRRQNNFLRYFPVPPDRERCDSFPDDELVEIVDRAKRVEWQRDLLTANIDPYALTLDEFYRYLEKLEVKQNIDQALRDDKKRKEGHNETGDDRQRSRKKSKKEKKDANTNKGNNKRDKVCIHCEKWHPAPDDKCWSLEKNKKNKPDKFNRKNDSEKLFTALQMEQITKALSVKAGKKKIQKRQLSFAVKSDDESERYAADYFNFAIRDVITKNVKDKNSTRLTTELIVQLVSPNKRDTVARCLLDTGTSQSMVLKFFIPLSQKVRKNERPITWTTLSGKLVTEKLAVMQFKIPELSTSKEINWACHVDEVSNRDDVPYDMILGLDFLTELGFILDFSTKTIKWGESQVEMLQKGIVTDQKKLALLYQLSQDSTVLKQAESRQNRILDADYSKIELKPHVDSLDHLDSNQKKELL